MTTKKYVHHYACVVWDDACTHRRRFKGKDEIVSAGLLRQVSAGMLLGKTRKVIRLSSMVDPDHSYSDDILVIPRSQVVSLVEHKVEVEE